MAVFTNFATLSYNGITRNSNTVSGEILESVSAEKTAVSGGYSPGATLSYAIGLVNSSDAPVTDITVTDDLGAIEHEGATLYPLSYEADSLKLFVDGVLQPAPAVMAGPPLVVSGIEIPAGGSAVLVYEAAVTAQAPLASGSVITNTAQITGGGISVPLSVSATVPVEDAADLSIRKSVSPAVVTSNGELSYSFEILNTGNAEAGAADEVVVSDLFDPVLSNLQVGYNGAGWTRGAQYSYDEATGAFTTLPGQITVPAATYTQNEDGTWTVEPGTALLTVSGTIG